MQYMGIEHEAFRTPRYLKRTAQSLCGDDTQSVEITDELEKPTPHRSQTLRCRAHHAIRKVNWVLVG